MLLELCKRCNGPGSQNLGSRIQKDEQEFGNSQVTTTSPVLTSFLFQVASSLTTAEQLNYGELNTTHKTKVWLPKYRLYRKKFAMFSLSFSFTKNFR